MRRGLLSCAILGLVLLCGDGAAELINKRGKIEGENFVNLRSGPDLSYPSRAVLKKGEEVTVEKEEGGWYLVSLMDGRKGYVHRTLVVFRENGEVKPTVKNEDLKKLSVKKEQAITDPGREGEGKPQSLTAPTTKREPSKGKPLPLVKVLEGKEWEMLWWLGAVLCIFVIGWICGGNYYLRRDRVRRTKLHF